MDIVCFIILSVCWLDRDTFQIRSQNTDSDVATAIRTSVVLLLSIAVTFIAGEYKDIINISFKSLIFLIISGLETGASWICYF